MEEEDDQFQVSSSDGDGEEVMDVEADENHENEDEDEDQDEDVVVVGGEEGDEEGDGEDGVEEGDEEDVDEDEDEDDVDLGFLPGVSTVDTEAPVLREVMMKISNLVEEEITGKEEIAATLNSYLSSQSISSLIRDFIFKVLFN